MRAPKKFTAKLNKYLFYLSWVHCVTVSLQIYLFQNQLNITNFLYTIMLYFFRHFFTFRWYLQKNIWKIKNAYSKIVLAISNKTPLWLRFLIYCKWTASTEQNNIFKNYSHVPVAGSRRRHWHSVKRSLRAPASPRIYTKYKYII